jgi:hypothetical protein
MSENNFNNSSNHKNKEIIKAETAHFNNDGDNVDNDVDSSWEEEDDNK